MATRWRGLLAPIGVPTGDGRRMAVGSVTHRELPLPLKWQRADSGAHDDSVIVGSLESVDIREDGAWGEGELFDDRPDLPRVSEDVAEALMLLDRGVIGPSVDGGAATAIEVIAGTDDPVTPEVVEQSVMETGEWPETELLFTEYEIAAATLVSIPAFAECRPFEVLRDGEVVSSNIVAAVIGTVDLPVADREREWDGPAATRRVFDFYTDGDDVNTEGISQAFLYRDPDANPETQAAYSLGFADVIDGELRIVPRGVAATAGGRGVNAADIPDNEKSRIRSRICSLYDRVRGEFDDWPDCPFDDDSAESVVAANNAPDSSWFTDPGLSEVTAIVTTEDGRIFGHFADPNVCHVGYRDDCVTPPESITDHALFHRYPVQTSDGSLISVGRLTTGHGDVGTECDHATCRGLDDHACMHFSFLRTVEHHDRLRTLAWVRVGYDEANDAWWMSGVLADDITDADRAVLSRRRVSGDWRNLGQTEHGATRELCEILALANAEPGFPIPRTTVHMRDGQPVSLVAAGIVLPKDGAELTEEAIEFDYDRLAELTAEKLAERMNPVPEVDTDSYEDETTISLKDVARVVELFDNVHDQIKWLASRRIKQLTGEM